MNHATLIDRYGNPLNFDGSPRIGVYVSTGGDDDVTTAGPFTYDELRVVLDEFDPDRDMDGGVTCAAIEAETTADADPSVDYHAKWRKAERDARAWQRAAHSAGDRAEAAEGRVAVLEGMTAREHLDAADLSEVSCVIVSGPGGSGSDRWAVYVHGARLAIQDDGRTLKVLPLDSPAPARPEWEALHEAIRQTQCGDSYVDTAADELARALYERGVRAPEGGEGR